MQQIEHLRLIVPKKPIRRRMPIAGGADDDSDDVSPHHIHLAQQPAVRPVHRRPAADVVVVIITGEDADFTTKSCASLNFTLIE